MNGGNIASYAGIKALMAELGFYAWKLGQVTDFRMYNRGEYMPDGEPAKTDSIEKLDNLVEMYSNLYPGSRFRIELRKNAKSNGSGVVSDLDFVVQPGQGNGLAGFQAPAPVPPAGLSPAEVQRMIEMAVKENDLRYREREIEQKLRELQEERRRLADKNAWVPQAMEVGLGWILKHIGAGEAPAAELGTAEESEQDAPDPKREAVEDLAASVYGIAADEAEVRQIQEMIETIAARRKAKAEEPDELEEEVEE